MTEWGVVGVIIALVGFVGVLVKPLLSLNTSIVKLTTKMEGLGDGITELRDKNTKSHDRIWEHEERQDAQLTEDRKQLEDHERRIGIVEGREK